MFQKTFTLAKALLSGETVSEERLKKRLEICSTCDKKRTNSRGEGRCGVCGCRLKGDKSLVNLARYEKPGCKHPRGSKWERNGV